MRTGRLEAFSDGVLAIIITIMVLELRPPHEASVGALRGVLPHLATYLMSFVYLGIYWNNHHHMLQTCRRVTGGILWANLHLLFWLSLVPFVTAWLGETMPAAWPAALYGVAMLMAAIAYFILQQRIIADQGPYSLLARAVGNDWKGKMSPPIYALAVGAAFLSAWISVGCYVLVALIWLVPDPRIERVLAAVED